ncbi:UvrD/REP helicase [Listeria floridensis FSL S10-1187]|uniref:UvrD/REP helicase n=1 Tax=Listeria floridensis FSL S10-1187 TaxID=1265817 RepID=A0ABP3AXD9_9LIST|nr:RNA polymerase recycling motor HelD [Listeria floridensis]EUJ31247.1 UvrD/REP helicase [Listeria floridensis FSL S10-1187]
MDEEKHEQERIDYTIEQIKKQEEKISDSLVSVKQEASDIRSNFWDDVRVNLLEPDDVSETNISIRQQEHFLRERERNYEHAEKQLAVFDKMKNSPYFARIDIQDAETPREEIYIGIGSALDENDQFLVYDWRAPISSVYYDGEIGEASYDTPQGKLTVDVLLKRQFSIKDGKLVSMFDTSAAIGDEMLQEVLGSGSNVQMKNIVSTIQREQNRIIRDTKSELLFVQGAAGSGKTSAVLQRIAYLLYRFRDGLDEKQMIIFSPNRLFNHYIGNVLPELGEKNMQQTTFQDFITSRLGKLEVESLFEQFEDKENKLRQNIIGLKEEIRLFAAISRYQKALQKTGLCFKDIRFRGRTIISKERVSEIFYNTRADYGLSARLELARKALREEIYVFANEEIKRDWVKDEIELLSEERYQELVPLDLEFDGFDAEQDYLARKIVRLRLKKVHQAIKENRFFHIRQQFVHFMQSVPKLVSLEEARITDADWKAEVKRVVANLNANKLALEDTVFYLDLWDAVVGKNANRAMRFLFIDEIQDYSPAQIYYLKTLFPSSKFTLLGDLNQAIFKTQEKERTLLEEIKEQFDPEKTEVVRLSKSYRSTEQITNFTKGIIQAEENIEAFSRKGNLPKLIESQSFVAMMDAVYEEALRLQKTGKMIAIIGKDQEICEEAYLSLYKKMKVRLVHMEHQKLQEGVMIIPSYLAKGLEFDGVIALDASSATYQHENERTLLYTICSRAMHELVVTANGSLSPLFDGIPSKLYEIHRAAPEPRIQ